MCLLEDHNIALTEALEEQPDRAQETPTEQPRQPLEEEKQRAQRTWEQAEQLAAHWVPRAAQRHQS